MLRRYTNCTVLTLCLTLGACSTVPLPFAEREAPSPAPASSETSTQDNAAQPAMATTQQAVVVPPLKSGTQALFDRALELLRDGKPEAAQVLFEELTVDQPELAGPWVNLGNIHLARGDQEQASAAFNQALAANPDNCDALNQLGVMARRAGRFEDAEKHYQRCLQAQPGYANALLNLGILYELYMGRFGEALAAYNDYQLMLAEPDTRVTGWVMDLERRAAAIAKR